MVQEITFAQWLKSRRRILDLTQQALAEQVNCSAEMIYRIEAGQRRPSTQIAQLLGQVLNIQAAEMDAFIRFARTQKPTKIHAQHVEITPWRDAFVPSNNLPLQLTTLIGRKQHLVDAISRLRQDAVRLLTLVGPPGIGKTRLAVQLGNDVLLDFPDGVFLVELASTTHADRVILAIAHTLGIALTDHKKPKDSLHTYLHDRQLLLILDNFEQILDAAPDIQAMLATCPLVKVIVTSRAPLRIRGEHQFPVDSLSLPGRIDDLNIQGLAGFAAVQLFMERAKAVHPDFELTPQNAPHIAAICARLEGLPLAIEIVATQITILQPEEILNYLTGRSLLESQGMIDNDQRHHSLAAAINWSFRLLNTDEQEFFCRLGVFANGCAMEAAQSVCQPQGDIVLMLSKLVGMNLIKRETVTHDTSRYRLLEIIRQFAQQELQTRGEWKTIQERHAAYFHNFVLEHETSVRTNGQVIGLEKVEREHDNIQTAIEYFIAARLWQKGLELVNAMIEFWVYHNHIIVGLRYTTTLLDWTASDATLSHARTHALNGAAIMSYFAGDFPAIGPYAEKALASAKLVNSSRDIAMACTTLGMQNGGMGNFEAAIRYFEQGIDAVKYEDLPWETASLWNGLGEVERSQGHYEAALKYYSTALDLSDGMGNLWLSAHILDNIGHTAYSQGRYDMADAHIRRSMEASIALGDERGIAMCLEKLGGIAIARKQLELAARLLGAAEALRETKNTPIEGMDAADYQQFVEQLHQQLAADVLEVVWNEGRSLPLSQIIDQALEN
ncbi:MAG: helix-turn-helix domain-containing protein [Anaerolineae bacterium]|nr:helix-turn-helix domain-containing protein [Anaerolineae bacterium]